VIELKRYSLQVKIRSRDEEMGIPDEPRRCLYRTLHLTKHLTANPLFFGSLIDGVTHLHKNWRPERCGKPKKIIPISPSYDVSANA
jgi:hypothetical protein